MRVRENRSGGPGDVPPPARLPLTVKGVCPDEAGRVLLCRNHRGEWELPGGRPHPGEPFPSCLEREVREETGLRIAVRQPMTAYPYEVVPGAWVTVLAYGCELLDAGTPRASAEHTEVEFRNADELDDLTLAAGYRTAIQAWLSTP